MDLGRPSAPQPDGSADGEPRVLLSHPFTIDSISEVRHTLAARVAEAGVHGPAGEDFVLAVHELVTNAVRHGGGTGHLDLRLHDDMLSCEVTDHGGATGPVPVHLSAVTTPGGRGLWLAHHLTGTLILTNLPDGVSATVTVCLAPAPVTPDDDTVMMSEDP